MKRYLKELCSFVGGFFLEVFVPAVATILIVVLVLLACRQMGFLVRGEPKHPAKPEYVCECKRAP